MWGWRIFVVTSDVSLVLLNGNLCAKRSDGRISLPLDDLDVVILESGYGSITVPLLRKLAEKGILLVVTDHKSLPAGIYLPAFQSTNLVDLVYKQAALSLPFKKRIWQKIIKQKIVNCAKVLELLGKEGSDVLLNMAKEVKSGDSTKREAYSAKIYFNFLSDGFSRNQENPINSALDYGYALVRATVARALSATGLLCAFGIAHKSKTNPFNLADDFVEVFRPFVDLMVFSNPPNDELTTDYKRYLLKIFKMECLIENKVFTVSTASWFMAQSYARAIQKNNYKLLELPLLDSLSFREVEVE